MAIYQLRYFADIVAAVREELQVQSTDTTAINRIKRDVNIVYTELRGKKRWSWLKGTANVQLPAYVSTGSAAVVGGSASVTLTSAPVASKAGLFFAVDGYSEIYRIESHTAGAFTLMLDDVFTGATNASATYKIWTDSIGLPSEARETVEVWHDHYRKGLANCGAQEWRRIVSTSPRAEGKPSHYHTEDFADAAPTTSITSLPASASRSSVGTIRTIVFASGLPAAITAKLELGEQLKWRISGAGAPAYNGDISIAGYSTTNVTNDTIQYVGKGDLYETSTADVAISILALNQDSEFSRQRLLRVHPSLSNSRVTLHVDYIRDVPALENDFDEPLMPVEERAVLLYGVLHRAWSRLRNPEEATRNLTLYRDMLMEMEGRLQDGFDKPKLKPSAMYLRAKRNSSRGSMGSFGGGAPGGGSAHAVVTGTANAVAVFNTAGEIDSSASVTSTELAFIDGLTSNAQDQITDAQTDADAAVASAAAAQVDATQALSDAADAQADATAAQSAATQAMSDAAAAQVDADAAQATADAHIADTSGAHVASAISNTPSGNLAATNLQTAVDELQTDVDSRALSSALTDHISDATDAHAASAITNTPSGNLAATTVQGALNELQTDIDTRLTAVSSAALTNKTFDADGTGNSISNIENADIKAAAAIALNKLAAATSSRALVSDGSGFISPATTTATEIGYVNGVTSAIQTQLDAKASSAALTTHEADTSTHGVAVAIVGTTETQTLTNKTLTSPTVNTPTTDVVTWDDQASTPASPSSGFYKTYFKSDGKLYKLNSSGTEVEVGSGGAGGINYVQQGGGNHDAESGTTGWTTYADGAATPVDLTAGSPSATWTQITSSQLRGTASFKLTAGALGDGVAYTITPDRADLKKGAVMSCSFDYEVSGTTATGDYTVWIYDVANSVLIQPAGYQVSGGVSTGGYKHIFSFQLPTNGTTFRVGIHQAVASPAGNLTVDNVVVGPQAIQYGAPVTDWTAFTPTGTWVSNTSYTGYWRRNGDTMDLRIKVLVSGGAPTSASLTVTLPFGSSVDTGKVVYDGLSSATVGYGTIRDSASAPICGIMRSTSSTPTLLNVMYEDDGATGVIPSTVNQAAPFTFGDTDSIVMYATVPIVGWSSSVQMSSDTNTRVTAARAYTATPTGTIASSHASSTAIVWGTKEYDTHGAYNSTTGGYTIPQAGIYQFSGQICVEGTEAANGAVEVHPYINGVAPASNALSLTRVWASGVTSTPAPFAFQFSMNAGDVITFRAESSITSPVFQTNTGGHYLQIHKLSGPSAIAASETVAAKAYATQPTGTIASAVASSTAIVWGSSEYDTHGSYSTSTGAFTAPIQGFYAFKGIVHIGATEAANESIEIHPYVNGAAPTVPLRAIARIWASGVTGTPTPFDFELRLLAGDVVTLRAVSATTSPVFQSIASPFAHYLHIRKVGNY